MARFLCWLVLLLAAGPAAGQGKPLAKIAFGSCADQDKPLPIFDAIADQKPDLLVLLGDTIYADLHLAKGEQVTTDRIKAKYDVLAKLPAWQRLRGTCPLLATWDDHDYGKNDAGVEWHLKDESQAIFLDFFGVPPDSPRRKQKGVYNAATFGPEGQRVQVILLDERYFRSPLKTGAPTATVRRPYLPTTESGATFLGDEQWKWLEDRLREPAELRLIGSGIQVVADEHPFEKWANIPAERDRLFKLIRDTRANGVVVLSGDRHLAELSILTDAVGYPLYDVTSSGFNQADKGWRAPEKNSHRVAAMPYGDNFGVVTVDWSAADPVVGLQLRDVTGEIVVRHTLPISLLQAKGEPKEKPKLPDGVIGPEEALKKIGQEVTLQMEVKSGRAVSMGKRVLLNSDKDFRSEKNFTVVVNEKAMSGKYEKATFDTFKDKTVRVKGKVTEFQKKPQIEVNDAAVLEIVGK